MIAKIRALTDLVDTIQVCQERMMELFELLENKKIASHEALFGIRIVSHRLMPKNLALIYQNGELVGSIRWSATEDR